MTLRMVSWNILQGGGKRSNGIAEAVQSFAPDVLILQEFRNGRNASILLDALDCLDLGYQDIPDGTAGKNSVLLASRHEMSVAGWHAELDSSRARHAYIATPSGSIEILAAHLPHKSAQRPYFNFLLEDPELEQQAALVIGDLNCGTPFEDSQTRSFDNTHLFQQLLQRGWTDCWRSRHPAAREFSWVSSRGYGYRYDHCLATQAMDTRIDSIHYEHAVRESGLSDHSALIVQLH